MTFEINLVQKINKIKFFVHILNFSEKIYAFVKYQPLTRAAGSPAPLGEKRIRVNAYISVQDFSPTNVIKVKYFQLRLGCFILLKHKSGEFS